ncbi:hypothetical protein KZO25_10180 [Halomonas sp. ANAO-440]|uniref:hypothetical protein n=1 Tax=Halomonas sp. ANAO-440 TaxID=2861360 RepID=UPI001CAA6D7F|nr:hypothetical protein [Halomonas sp. ANAO-440]MBZ0330680.1 hypothetical protein [Halomonas sp. ANAO-440]
MLNRSLKKDAISELEATHHKYEKRAADVTKAAEALMETRAKCSEELVGRVESYINTLANSPKEFDRSFSEFKAEYQAFDGLMQEVRAEAERIEVKAGGSAAAGISAGVATAAFAPSAAMAIATTFGTASTGTAISALSGAAASKAALAWLGGGALVAGGKGMAGGAAILGLANPVGIAIGVTALVGSGFFARKKNRKIAEECHVKRKEIEVLDAALKASLVDIESLHDATKEHASGMDALLTWLSVNGAQDYQDFDKESKDKLAALVNHMQILTPLINKTVSR